MTDAALQALLDRQAVIDRATQYAFNLDRKDWAGFRACFTDQLETDFSDFGAGPARTAPAEDFIAFDQRVLPAEVTTQHLIANHVVTIDGDEAVLFADAIASHHRADGPPPHDYDVHGAYRMVMERTAEGWKIAKVRLSLRWYEGDPATLGER